MFKIKILFYFFLKIKNSSSTLFGELDINGVSIYHAKFKKYCYAASFQILLRLVAVKAL